MKPRLTISICAACAWLAGCTAAPAPDPLLLQTGQELTILRDKAAVFSSVPRRLRLVIHDAGTLAMLPIDVGPVDFDREMVLLAAMGPTPSDEYRIRIQRVCRDGDSLRADVLVQYPAAGLPHRGIPASPYHAVILPKCELNVRGFDGKLSHSALRPAGRRQ